MSTIKNINQAKSLPFPDLNQVVNTFREGNSRFCFEGGVDLKKTYLTTIFKLRETYGASCNYLEIGTLFGFSLAHALQSSTPGVVVGVDLFENSSVDGIGCDFRRDVKNGHSVAKTFELTEAINLHNHPIYLVSGNSQAESTFNKVCEICNQYDMIYIDGDHSFEGSYADFTKYSPLLKPGGYLLFDDYHIDTVRQTIDKIKLDHLDEYDFIKWEGFNPRFPGFFHKKSNEVYN